MGILNTPMATQLSADEVLAYERDGYLVRRGALEEVEVARLETGFAKQPPMDGTLFEGRELQYPEPGRYTLANNCPSDPDLGFIIEHPAVVGPAAQLLGDEPRLTAFVVYDRTPGGPPIGIHNDYKRWRPVGSSMHWLFTIVPFCDFDADAGPLYVAPGSHRLERVTDGPERPLEVAPPAVPAPEDFIDPELRRGDVLFMNMHLWHKADGNNADHHRVGIFNKYCAASFPPATGYLLYDDAVADALSPDRRDLIAVHSDLPIVTTRVLLHRERRGIDEVLLCDGALPGGPVHVEQAIPDWDHGNYIAAAQAALRDRLLIETPWLSYVGDYPEPGGLVSVDGLTRVYAYTLTGRGFPVAYEGEWVPASELDERFGGGSMVADALQRWLDPTITRGKGLTQAQSRIDQYSY